MIYRDIYRSLILALFMCFTLIIVSPNLEAGWQAGIARVVITPVKPVWLAGYGSRREPDGKIHDLWMKAIAIKDESGHRAVLISSDFQGVPKSMSDRVFVELKKKHELSRSDVMFTFSHNHCGPRLGDDLLDYYPVDPSQEKLIAEYTDKMVLQTVEVVNEALKNLEPAELSYTVGQCTFAVNRRNNVEAKVPEIIKRGEKLKGPVDHDVPVLQVNRPDGTRLAILFGYACHPTTLSFTKWCGDYPGFAQIQLEKTYPGVTAMFVNTCGGDINPLPRRTVALCEIYGGMLADGVEAALKGELKPVSPKLNTAFELVKLDYLETVSADELKKYAGEGSSIRSRWARRLLGKLETGTEFDDHYPYPLHVWQLGSEVVFIGMGAETVVDYSLMFKQKYGEGTWVMGYADDMIAYIPSRRVWEEGGYEGGWNLYEYGRPAFRWAGNVEETITASIARMIQQVRTEQ